MWEEGYLWNSGIFVWRADDFLDEVRALTPEVAPALSAGTDIERFFQRTKATSVDVGVLERSAKVDPASPSTPEEHADDLHRLIQALDAGPAVYSWLQQILPLAIQSPVVGLYSPTDSAE